MSRVLVLDPSAAGISGDRVVAALIDLGADEKRTVEAMLATRDHLRGCSRLEISVEEVLTGGFRAKRLRVDFKESKEVRKVRELIHGLKELCSTLKLTQKSADFAIRTLQTLTTAESKLHGGDPSRLHFHELGSVDTLVDIVGSACALDDLHLFDEARVVSMPVATGGGRLTFSHGTVPVPAPAVLEIASTHDIELVGGPVEGELTTPTGMAILANLASETTRFYPPMKPMKVGLGAGKHDLEGVPNMLRVTLGRAVTPSVEEPVATLETNLDDVTGEYLAHSSEVLMEAGARDVSIIPAISKNGRPGYVLRVIADVSKSQELADKMMIETGTLGVRMATVTRYVSHRRVVPTEIELRGKKVTVNVKVSRNAQGKLVALKPEYRDIARLSKETGTPARMLYSEVVSKIGRKFS